MSLLVIINRVFYIEIQFNLFHVLLPLIEWYLMTNIEIWGHITAARELKPGPPGTERMFTYTSDAVLENII